MSNEIEHSIHLTYNSCGFSGKDIEDSLPEWETERDIEIGLAWAPCADGPNSFLIVISVGACLGSIIGTSFLEELGADLYKWTKNKLAKILKRKNYYSGSVQIEFIDKSIILDIENELNSIDKLFKKLSAISTEVANKHPEHKKISISFESNNKLETRLVKLKHVRLFITTKFKASKNKAEIEHLCSLVQQANFEDFCFIRDVENYQKVFNDPKKLMQRAREEISKSDALLIDMTDKPTGRAIEAGIAYALGKKIIIIFQKGTKIKDTSKGIADVIIEYNNISDILPKLKTLCKF